MSIVGYVKNYWRRWNVGKAAAGDVNALNQLYRFEDPWGLDVPEEHFRFQETARIIQASIGRNLGSVLEVGCGEGLQTQYLAAMAKRIVGLDPSRRAIKRARARKIPNASFLVGDLLSAEGQFQERFDLITACEVLYYCSDCEIALEKLNKLSRACLVTYYRGAYERMDKFFCREGMRSETIRIASYEWKVVYWHTDGTVQRG